MHEKKVIADGNFGKLCLIMKSVVVPYEISDPVNAAFWRFRKIS